MATLNDYINSFLKFIEREQILTDTDLQRLTEQLQDEDGVRIFISTYIKPEIKSHTYDSIVEKYSSLIPPEIVLSDSQKQKLFRFSCAFCKFVV